MITLYTHPMSPCAQKVRLVLAEKGLPYEAVQVDLPAKENLQPWYLKLNPLGVVPTLTEGEHVVYESSLVCEYLEEAHPGATPLRPEAAHLRHRMRLWMKLVDSRLHPSCGALQWPLAMRPRLLAMDETEALALIAQVVEAPRRERQLRLFRDGLEAADVRGAVSVYCETIDRMEADLVAGDWLLGEEFSLADIVVAPYFQTLLQYGWTSLYSEKHPRVSAWVKRVTERGSWERAVSAEFSDAHLFSLRSKGREAWPTIQSHAEHFGFS